MCPEEGFCALTKSFCVLSFVDLTQRDSMRNQPWKTFPCWVSQEARSAQSWGEQKGSRSLRISVVEKRGVCFSPFLLLLRQSVQAGSCSLADFYHGKVFVLFCLLPQVCLYGGYSSAQHPSKETIPAPSERTSHGDQIWAGNHTEGGSLDYGVQEKLRTSKTRVWKCQ